MNMKMFNIIGIIIFKISRKKHYFRSRSKSRSRSRSRERNIRNKQRELKSKEKITSKNEALKSPKKETDIKYKKNEIKNDQKKEIPQLNELKKNEGIKEFSNYKQEKIEENKEEVKVLNENPNSKPIMTDIKLISVNFIDDNEKYIEEFIQLKKLAKLEREKNMLPSIIKKIPEERKLSSADKKSEYDLEKKFQLRGLVHEKDEFLSDSLKNQHRTIFGKQQFLRRIEGNSDYDNKRKFAQRMNKNFGLRRNGFNGNIRGRNWNNKI